MKQTENYQLNQWEQPDRIIMEDFNADNAKIDAAIYSEANRVADLPHGELICGGVTAETVERVDLDVSEIDWSRWLFVALEVQFPYVWQARLRCFGNPTAKCYYGHLGNSAYSSGEIGFIAEEADFAEVIIPVLYRGDHAFHAINASSRGTFGLCNMPLDTITSFALTPRMLDSWVNIPAGTLFRLWGVR